MTRILVDTDVYSFILKSSPEARRFEPLLSTCQIVLSFQTVAELFKWTIIRNWHESRIAGLEAAIRACVVVPYDWDMAWTWARVAGECSNRGRPMAVGDAWVAASAIRHNTPLLTNNVRHFEAARDYCGLQIAQT